MGNRTRAETITAGATQLTNYTYNIANQLISDGAQSFSYDANGRLISAGDRSYTYALNDRLIALSQPGLSATFANNGDGVRLAQTENGSTTRYLVDTQRSYSEVVGAITPESETWYLLGLDVLGQQQGSDWSYFAYDGLGSVRLALDSSGSPSAGMRYEPYGQPAASWGTPPALGFTGEWTDSSGLLYLRARYLDPSSATFLSRDPFEGLPTRVLSRNGYSWVEGNPVMNTDPSGLSPGCGNKSCQDFLDEMYNIIQGVGGIAKGLCKRLTDMLDDVCQHYDRDVLGIPMPMIKAVCYRTNWRGHMKAFDELQRGLDRAIRCYERRGQDRFDAIGDASDRCDTNNSTYTAALGWSSRKLNSGDVKPTKWGGVPVPSLPPAPFVALPPELTAPSFTPPPIPAPEPPYPYGRGYGVPASGDCGPLCDLAGIGLIGGLCLPALGALMLIAPEMVAGTSMYCAANPQYCMNLAR